MIVVDVISDGVQVSKWGFLMTGYNSSYTDTLGISIIKKKKAEIVLLHSFIALQVLLELDIDLTRWKWCCFFFVAQLPCSGHI